MLHRAAAAFVFLVLSVSFALGQDQPLPPEESPHHIQLPAGFQATLFAGEPDVAQPIAMAFDDRGRLWVVECYSYPDWEEGIQDRILIFEDSDGDGRFDGRKVFWDQGTNITGLEIGFGGVWLCATPNLLFVPDRDANDVPDGPPEVLLDGWDLEAKHNVFNGLKWGPDGWLYGLNGILSNSRVGKPGTPDQQRVGINCGVWRFHPTRQEFEPVAWGTTNPWGIDFDDYGQTFITNCVIAHLWHVLPGAHYQRMYGQDFNPHLYGLMESCADHLHWAGGPWQSSRGGQGKHSDAGGGHAHAGAMIYLGDNWPDEYRNRVFTCNIHGNRVNQDVLERSGSGYVAHHADDFLKVADPWYRGLELKYGPDGGVFLTDWNDTGECHDYDTVERATGRIYKITYGRPAAVQVDLASLSDQELVRLQLHKNDWFVRHARRRLQERAAAGNDLSGAHRALVEMFQAEPAADRKLRALWALHVTGGLQESWLIEQLDHPDESVRGWAVRLLCEDNGPSAAAIEEFARLAKTNASARVRLELASALQRMSLEARRPVAAALAGRSEDAGDQNLALLVWYGIEPLAAAGGDAALALVAETEIPSVRERIARRMSMLPDPAAGLAPLARLLTRADGTALRLDVLRGMYQALQGRSGVTRPARWPAAYARLREDPSEPVRQQADLVGLAFGDRRAIASLRQTLLEPAAPEAARRSALQGLVEIQEPDLEPALLDLLGDHVMRGPALRGLAAYDSLQIPATILGCYASLTDSEKQDAMSTLASRGHYALALLDAIDAGQVPSRDLSAFTVRQLQALQRPEIDARLAEVWGTLRPPAQDKAAAMARYKEIVASVPTGEADPSRGRFVFARTCASCHKLFGEGHSIGPDLTGSQRTNLDYVLENLVDPSAIVGRDYQMTLVQTDDGRVVTGIVKAENENTLTLQTPNDTVILAQDRIDVREQSPLSMMPEGQLDKLTERELCDLITYLASPAQVPLPDEAAVGGDGEVHREE